MRDLCLRIFTSSLWWSCALGSSQPLYGDLDHHLHPITMLTCILCHVITLFKSSANMWYYYAIFLSNYVIIMQVSHVCIVFINHVLNFTHAYLIWQWYFSMLLNYVFQYQGFLFMFLSHAFPMHAPVSIYVQSRDLEHTF